MYGPVTVYIQLSAANKRNSHSTLRSLFTNLHVSGIILSKPCRRNGVFRKMSAGSTSAATGGFRKWMPLRINIFV